MLVLDNTMDLWGETHWPQYFIQAKSRQIRESRSEKLICPQGEQDGLLHGGGVLGGEGGIRGALEDTSGTERGYGLPGPGGNLIPIAVGAEISGGGQHFGARLHFQNSRRSLPSPCGP